MFSWNLVLFLLIICHSFAEKVDFSVAASHQEVIRERIFASMANRNELGCGESVLAYKLIAFVAPERYHREDLALDFFIGLCRGSNRVILPPLFTASAIDKAAELLVHLLLLVITGRLYE